MSGQPQPARASHVPLRDRVTWVSYAQMATYGWFLYAFGPSVPLLRDDQGTTRAVSSLHGTTFALGGILLGLTMPVAVARYGRGIVLRAGSLLLALGILGYVAAPGTPLTLLAAFVAGVGGSAMVVGVTAFLSWHQGAAAPAAISEANGVGAAAGLLGPLTVGLGVLVGWGWRPALVAVAVALVVVEIVRGRRVAGFGEPSGAHDADPSDHDLPGPMPARYWVSVVTLTLLIGVEFCLTLWGGDLLRDRGGLSSGAAAAALVTIVAGLAVGRFAGAQLAHRFDPERLLLGAIVLAAVGFLITWSSTTPWVMLAGLFVAGLGASLHFPLGIARAVRASLGRGDRASARSAVGVGLATGIAPFALGALADAVGVWWAFLVVPGLLATALVLVVAAPVPVRDEAPGR